MKKWLLTALAGVFIVGGIFIPLREHLADVWQTPEEVAKVKKNQYTLTEQTVQIGRWVEQREKVLDFQRQAPPGYYWDEVREKYEESK